MIHVLVRASITFAMLLLSGSGVCAQSSPTGAPTPVREQMQRFLDALNSGDRATIERYAQTSAAPHYQDSAHIDKALDLYKQTGGLDVIELSEPKPDHLRAWARARDADALMEITFGVEASPPHRVSLFHIDWPDPPPKYLPQRLTEAATIEALRTEASRRAKADKFSGALLIARGDQVLLREAYGLADRERKIPNAIETRFRTASVTKMFTAVAVLRLVQDGKLKLDDPIGKLLPEVAGKPIAPATVHQLLTHTSGAGDLFDDRYFGHQRELRTHADYVKVFGGDALRSAPGTRYEYSNLGFILLGEMIERVSGKTYYDYVHETVFEPAGMTRTGSLPEDVPVEGRAIGYDRPAGTHEWISALPFIDYRGFAACGAYTTVDDLARFLSALRSSKLLNEKYTRLMLEPKTAAWKGLDYAYGVTIESYPLMGRWMGHNGRDHGMNAEAWFSPETNYVVIALSNFDPPGATQLSNFTTARLPLR